MTGHGNVVLMTLTAIILKNYLLAGGFLHIDDNYGMNQYIRKEIKKYFQIMSWLKYLQRTPFFKTIFFPNGLPKIHEHDGKRPQAFGIL
jgi:hypothetical protein